MVRTLQRRAGDNDDHGLCCLLAISGSNTATAATMSSVAIPEMKKYHYHPMLNAGSVAAGANVGVLIPPSIVLVVYAFRQDNPSANSFWECHSSAILTVLIAATVFYIVLAIGVGPKGRRAHGGKG